MLKQGFDPLQWNDEKHCTEACEVRGNLETLREYGTHQGRHAESAAHFAVVYLDAPILRACNIIDLPGFENDAVDTEMAKANPIQGDVAIYACPFVGFMNGQDLMRVAQIIRELPAFEQLDPKFEPLSNLLVVATHAAPQIRDGQVDGALAEATRRLWRNLSSSILADRAKASGREINAALVRSRLFTFYRETPNRRVQLEGELRKLLGETLPRVWRERADNEVVRFRDRSKGHLAAQLAAYTQMTGDMRRAEQELEQIRASEPQRRTRMRESRERVEGLIVRLRSESMSAAHDAYTSDMDVKRVEQVIREHFEERKDAQQYAAAYLLEQLQHKIETKTGQLAEQLSHEVKRYLDQYSQAIPTLDGERQVVNIPFNAEGAFVGGLAGAATVGALAAWAATLGNLGAYVIAAKVVGLLSAFGISIPGGTAAVMSFIAAIGGPLTIAVGIVSLAALAGWALFGSSWQQRLAKKIVTVFAEKNVLGGWQTHLATYWDETHRAFQAGANEVEVRWTKYIGDLSHLVSQKTAGKDELTKLLSTLEAARDFFAGIPWVPRGRLGTDGSPKALAE